MSNIHERGRQALQALGRVSPESTDAEVLDAAVALIDEMHGTLKDAHDADGVAKYMNALAQQLRAAGFD